MYTFCHWTIENKRYQGYLWFGIINWPKIMQLSNQLKVFYDIKCPINTNSLNRKGPFNELSSARSYEEIHGMRIHAG